jgi:putative endonuclease
MKRENRQTGRIGEEAAAEALAAKGYRIIERNWGNKFGEIDIIAKDGEVLVFCEVKTKIGETFGTPEEMAGPGKLGKVRRMATTYLEGKEATCRIDVVAVVLDQAGRTLRLTHYPNVY